MIEKTSIAEGMDLVIYNVQSLCEARVIEKALILVKDGYIVDIIENPEEEIVELARANTKKSINGKGLLAAPGLINTHTHIAMGLFRNYADDLELMEWLQTAIWPVEAKLNTHYIEWGTKLGIAEMLRSGTTCFSDMYFFMDTTAKVVAETGMRAVLSRGMAGVAPTAEQALVESKELYQNWHGYNNEQIKVMLGPHAPYTCPDEYMKKVMNLSHEIGAQIHMHLSETKTEVQDVLAATGKTPIAHMNDLGVFENGCVAAHCVHVTEEDMDIMAAKKVRVAHNPQSNLKLASGMAPVSEMMDKGIIVGLGTDGSASNNNADMLEEVRLAATLHKARLYNPKAIPAQTAWELGTINGAKVLDYPDLGYLAKGYRADIVLYDVSGLHWLPRYNDLASLVYAANSSDAHTTIVAGNVLMENKKLLTIDEEQLRAEMSKAKEFFA